MNEVTLEYKESADADQPDTEIRGNLPRFGRSWLWLFLFLIVYFVGLGLYFFGYGIVVGAQNAELVGTGELDSLAQDMIEKHAMSAAGMSGAYITMFLVLMPVIYLASNFKNQSWKDTLSIKRFTSTALYYWLGILAIFFLIQMLVLGLVDPPLTEFTEMVINSKSIGLALVMILLAPIVEEFVFRGYLFKAWRHTRLGLYGTLTLTSLLFVALHIGQYHWLTMVFLFILSLILSLSREKTGSVLVPIIIHGVNNLMAVTLAYTTL